MISSGAGRWAVWAAGKQTRARRRDGDYFCGDAAGDLGTWSANRFMGFTYHIIM